MQPPLKDLSCILLLPLPGSVAMCVLLRGLSKSLSSLLCWLLSPGKRWRVSQVAKEVDHSRIEMNQLHIEKGWRIAGYVKAQVKLKHYHLFLCVHSNLWRICHVFSCYHCLAQLSSVLSWGVYPNHFHHCWAGFYHLGRGGELVEWQKREIDSRIEMIRCI